ncbi:MAG: extensin family protein [Mesorhizobium sp.]|nr:extensin family protein [Mesorhizobium sp.]
MVKLSIPQLALAIAIPSIFLISPTEPAAAKSWLEKRLEKVFSTPQKQSSKKRKQRRAKSAQSGGRIILPDTAPVPEFAVRGLALAQPVVPEDQPAQGASQGEAAEDVKTPSGEAKESASAQPSASSPGSQSAQDERPAGAVELPETAPAPTDAPDEVRPDPDVEVPGSAVPVPEEKPAVGKAEPLDALPAEPPKPEFRPDKPDQQNPAAKTAQPAEPPRPPDPRSAVRPDASGKLPEEELACRRRLNELGVKFKEAKAESDPLGCSMPYPIVVQSLGGSFELAPDAEMNCATAEATARFSRDVISPAAKTVFGATLGSISHASAFVCRPRNGSQKLSEHAFGNALDISAFTLSDGTVVAVELEPPEKNLRFLTQVRAAACGPFKTVIGPGSNADHAEHLHFDLAPRRNGGTVCD